MINDRRRALVRRLWDLRYKSELQLLEIVGEKRHPLPRGRPTPRGDGTFAATTVCSRRTDTIPVTLAGFAHGVVSQWSCWRKSNIRHASPASHGPAKERNLTSS